jgi:hypothetical protein
MVICYCTYGYITWFWFLISLQMRLSCLFGVSIHMVFIHSVSRVEAVVVVWLVRREIQNFVLSLFGTMQNGVR